ncbi:MAG: ABC transporter substrate-binding protein [Lacibacter sp.]
MNGVKKRSWGRIFRFHFLCILCVALQLACGKRETANGYFQYNEQAGIATLDPAFAKNQATIWAAHQLYNTLVETNDQMEIIPSLARKWEQSSDGLQFTFWLRTDVFFHDHPAFKNGKGRRMTARDVVYSFRRLMNPATASPGAWVFRHHVDPQSGFSALNDSVFSIRLKKPFQPLLGVLTNQYCSVVPKEAVESSSLPFRNHPCGTGPFRLKAWEEGQVLLMERNPSYFETDSAGQPLPYLNGVKVSFLESKAAEFLAFRQKKLHFLNDIDPTFKDEVLTRQGVLRKRWQGVFVLQKQLYLNVEYLGILQDTTDLAVRNSPLRFKAVRQAINYGIDRRKMIRYLRNSIGNVAENGFVPPGLPGFDSAKVEGYTYNPELARSLLQTAGYHQKNPVPIIKLLTIPAYADLGSYIAKQLADIGIRIQVEVMPKSLLLTQTANGDALFFRASWIADYPDPENFLSVFYGENPAPPNYTRYRNKTYDLLYEKAIREPDVQQRINAYRLMDQMLIQDAPIVPLWYDQVIRLVQPEVSGFKTNALNLLDLRKVKLPNP